MRYTNELLDLVDIDFDSDGKATLNTPPESTYDKTKIVINYFTDWKNTAILRAQSAISFDSETTGSDPRFDFRLWQIYIPSIDQVAVIDWFNLKTEQTKWIEVLLEVFADDRIQIYIQNAMFDCFWVYWKFRVVCTNVIDTRVLSQIAKAGLYDGYKFVLGNSTPNSLKTLALEYGYDHDKELQKSFWNKLQLDQEQVDYGARDAIVTYLIGKQLYTQLTQEQPQVVEAELGSIGAFAYMQFWGLSGDQNYILNLARSYEDAAHVLMNAKGLDKLMSYDPGQHAKIEEQYRVDPKELYTKVSLSKCRSLGLLDYQTPANQTLNNVVLQWLEKNGDRLKKWQEKPFNVNSPTQITAYLQSIGFDSDSSSKDVLFEIFSDHPERTELHHLIQYRSLMYASSRLRSYYDSYCSMRLGIQTSYSILATQGMGRSSSGGKASKDYQNPNTSLYKVQNAQNVSKYLPSHRAAGLDPIRSVVQARPGYMLCEIDLAASHAEFARHLTGDSALQEAKDSGVKLHFYTLAGMLALTGLNVTPQDCIELVGGRLESERAGYYKHLYTLSKIVFYCFLNGGWAPTLQQQFFKYEIFVSLRDCQDYIEACGRTYSGVKEFQNRKHREVNRTVTRRFTPDGMSLGMFGYTVTCDGAMVWLRAQVNKYGETKVKLSDAVSVQWMRPEATVMKSSLMEIMNLIIKRKLIHDYVHLVTFTHDSVLLEIHEDYIEEVLPQCFEITQRNMQRFIPDYVHEGTPSDCIKGQFWGKR